MHSPTSNFRLPFYASPPFFAIVVCLLLYSSVASSASTTQKSAYGDDDDWIAAAKVLNTTGEDLTSWLEVAAIYFSTGLSWLLLRLWAPFALMALCLSPFGQKRPRCDHHRPSLFNKIRLVFLGPHPCTGECVLVEGYSWQLLWDDLAWSLWAVELGLWSYLMVMLVSATVTCMGLVLYGAAGGSVMLVLGTIVLLLVFMQACSFCCLQVCLSGGGACLKLLVVFGVKCMSVLLAALATILQQVIAECSAICRIVMNAFRALCPCGQRDEPAPAGVLPENANTGEVDDLSAPLLMEPNDAETISPPPPTIPTEDAEEIVISAVVQQEQMESAPTEAPSDRGEQPETLAVDPELTLRVGGPRPQGNASRQRRTFCGPAFAWTMSLLPVMPENMWGGLVGAWLGTHVLFNTYLGNSWIAELLRMGWRRPVDLSAMTSEELGGWDMQVWHDMVRDMLVDVEDSRSGMEALVIPRAARPPCARLRHRPRAFNVVEQEGAFSERDGLFNWDQYSKNECWICCCESPRWDLWVSCRHSFCSECSEEMMRRVMPCPLCRTISTAVVRKSAIPRDAAGGVEAPSPPISQ